MTLYWDIKEEDLIQVLGALPDPPKATRAYLADAFGVLVSGDEPEAWWEALWRDRGEDGAAKAVAQLVISRGGKRVVSLIEAEVSERDVPVRADDPKLARLLFDESLDDFLRDQWALKGMICEYYEQTQIVEGEDDEELPEPQEEWDEEVFETEEDDEQAADDGPDILDLFSGKPRPSAQRGADWTLKRVQHPARGFLEVPGKCSEAELENFLWLHWERIDFGFDRPIYLVGKQKSLSADTRDRVDLLAKGKAGEHIAIELKIDEARRGDYTQLISYMGNLESSGVPADKVRGVLAEGAELGRYRTPRFASPLQQANLEPFTRHPPPPRCGRSRL